MVERIILEKVEGGIILFKMEARITLLKTEAKIALFNMKGRITLFKMKTRVTLFKLEENVTLLKLHKMRLHQMKICTTRHSLKKTVENSRDGKFKTDNSTITRIIPHLVNFTKIVQNTIQVEAALKGCKMFS